MVGYFESLRTQQNNSIVALPFLRPILQAKYAKQGKYQTLNINFHFWENMTFSSTIRHRISVSQR